MEDPGTRSLLLIGVFVLFTRILPCVRTLGVWLGLLATRADIRALMTIHLNIGQDTDVFRRDNPH
jgi:hypothetical protein